MKNIWLKVQGVSKVYPGTKALNKVDLEVKEGEIHAIVGENGAGKTTLMRILAGEIKSEKGNIYINGKEVELKSPRHAQMLGISLVHQELSLFPNLNVAENIFQNRQNINSFGFIKLKELYKDTRTILQSLKTSIDPKIKVEKLSISKRQLIEIAKALSINVKLLILDEPTAALSDYDAEMLFGILKDLKKKGVSILYITHRLKEVFKIADTITVLRDGKLISSGKLKEFSIEKIITLMVGREIKDIYPKENKIHDQTIFEVKNLKAKNFDGISFKLFKGEILGLFGLVGSGRTEMARVIFGLDKKFKGDVFLNSEEISISSPSDAISKGIVYLPEDRKEMGLFLRLSVRENIISAALTLFCGKIFMNRIKEKKEVKKLIDLTDIKTTNMEQKVLNLSGGNQQKVLLSKWLATKPKILIVDEPTKGIDVGARAKIHSLLCDLAKNGVSIIMISSDLPEIMGLSDRIAIMHENNIVKELKNKNLSEDIIMTYASGHRIQ